MRPWIGFVSICFALTLFDFKGLLTFIAGSLESANSSILAACRLFKEVVGEKIQDFMLMRVVNPSNLTGCGGDAQRHA